MVRWVRGVVVEGSSRVSSFLGPTKARLNSFLCFSGQVLRRCRRNRSGRSATRRFDEDSTLSRSRHATEDDSSHERSAFSSHIFTPRQSGADHSSFLPQVLRYMTSTTLLYHIPAVQLLWSLQHATPLKHIDSILARDLLSLSIPERLDSIYAFGVLWRHTGSAPRALLSLSSFLADDDIFRFSFIRGLPGINRVPR